MTRKSKNSKRKCKARKSTIKNRRGKGGIFSCANKSNSYESKPTPGPGSVWTGRKPIVRSESKLKSLFRENSQNSQDSKNSQNSQNSQKSTKNNGYGNYVITDVEYYEKNPPQTKVSQSYTGKPRPKQKKNKTL
jgi:hypothetical protein